MRKLLENRSNKASLRKCTVPKGAIWKESKHHSPELKKGHSKKVQKEPKVDEEWVQERRLGCELYKGSSLITEPRKSQMNFNGGMIHSF